MKHLSFLAFLLFFSFWLRPVQAQAQASDSLSQKLANVFANVDKSQVPTGYLYEAGVRFVEPRFFNGVLSDSNHTDMNVLRFLRAQLRSCRVAGTDTLPTLPAFNARLKGAGTLNGVIPVAVQYLRYASIRPDALQNNLLRAQNEQLFDVAGRTQSPYQTSTLFAAAPVLSYAPTNAVSFLFRRNLYLTGTGELPTSLFLDFDDGHGYQAATWGQAIGTNYPSTGVKHVKVRFGYASGTSYESWFDFNVLAIVTANRYDNNVGKNVHLQPIGAPYGASVSIRYGRGHGPHVVKPFIVVEQYNIARAAPSLVDCNNANNTVELFLPKIDVDFAAPSTSNFNDALEAAGYDLVYIDFDQNTDDITRNARVVERVIQEMNVEKNISRTQFGLATFPNVVMGMSMGGLIGRYALAEMTKDNNLFGAPDTRLYILHDSPQRGAYNPVGLQSLARSTDVPLNIVSLNPFSSGFLAQPTIAAFDDRLQDAVNVLNEPATQQLAILNAFNGRGDIRANTFIDGTYGDMVDFTRSVNAGKPQPAYEIVATSNGSQCGIGSGAPLGVAISTADTYTSTAGRLISLLNPIPYLGKFSLGVRGAAYGLPAYGQQATVSRMRVYIEYRLGIGYGAFSISIPIRFNLLNESASSPPNTLPYETLPGGTTNLSVESGDCANQPGIVGAFLRTTLYNGPICFVPSYSALDIAAVTPATAFAKYIDNTTTNTSAPRVARYLAQESTPGSSTVYNLKHLTFTARNSEWLFDVMQGSSYASNYCSTECSPFPDTPTIAGSSYFCLNSTNTYSVPNQPAGTTVSWTATTTAGTVTPAAYTGSSYALTANSSSAGTVTVQAVVSKGPCTLATIQRQVAVGPRFRLTADRTQLCTVYLTVTAPGYTNLTLTINGNSQTVSDGSRIPAQYENRRVVASLTGTNACTGQGETVNSTSTLAASANCAQRVANSAASVAPTAKIFPNPASSYVDVRLERAAAESTAPLNSAAEASFTVRVYNTFGQLRSEQPSQGSLLRLNTGTLPAGLYVIVLLRDGRIVDRQQLQVVH